MELYPFSMSDGCNRLNKNDQFLLSTTFTLISNYTWQHKSRHALRLRAQDTYLYSGRIVKFNNPLNAPRKPIGC